MEGGDGGRKTDKEREEKEGQHRREIKEWGGVGGVNKVNNKKSEKLIKSGNKESVREWTGTRRTKRKKDGVWVTDVAVGSLTSKSSAPIKKRGVTLM